MSERVAGQGGMARGLRRFEWRAVLFTVAWALLAIIYTGWAAFVASQRASSTLMHDMAVILVLINIPFPLAFLLWGWLDKVYIRTRLRRIPFLFAATVAAAFALQIVLLSVSNTLLQVAVHE